MKNLFILCVIPLHVFSQSDGKVRLDQYLINPAYPNKNFKISRVVWYHGKSTIQEVPYIDSKTDSSVIKNMVYTKYYLFFDSYNNQSFYYRNFSDTSKIVAFYDKGSNNFEYGGWDFNTTKDFEYDKCRKLPDTIIEGNKYKRYAFQKMRNNKTNDFVVYGISKQKDIPVKYLRPLNKIFGCSLVRMDTYYEGRLVGIDQFLYLSDYLSSKEKSVFKAWQRKGKPLK